MSKQSMHKNKQANTNKLKGIYQDCFYCRPALRYVYMLEFHPSLGLASRVSESLQNALKVKKDTFFSWAAPYTTSKIGLLNATLIDKKIIRENT